MEHVRIITDIKDILGMKDDWNRLLEQSKSGNIFVSWEWVTSWWQHFGADNKLLTVIIERNGGLLGIAPFMIACSKVMGFSTRCLCFVGQKGFGICPDHLDIIALVGFEGLVSAAIVKTILSHRTEWDKIFLSEMPQGSIFLNELKNELQIRKSRFYTGISNIAPYINLPSTKHVKKWKQKYNKLIKDNTVNIVSYATASQIEQAVDIARELIINSSKTNHRTSAWENKKFYSFHLDLARLLSMRNVLSVVVLYCNEMPVSVLYGYLDKNKYLLYSIGFNSKYYHYSVGQVLLGTYKEQLEQSNMVQEIDFLRGNEAYKYRWTDTHRENAFLCTYTNPLAGSVICSVKNVYHQIMKVCNSALNAVKRLFHNGVSAH